MFGFGKKKKQTYFDDKNLSKVLGVISLATGVRALELPKTDFLEFKREEVKITIIDELRRLQTEHWDKDAFDRLINCIQKF